MSGRHMAFPFHIGKDGRTVTPTSLDRHVHGEIVQLLLTNPGERPFLPTFGGGLRRLVFEGNNEATAGLAKAAISQALAYWLQERVEITALQVNPENAMLQVDLAYRIVATGEEKYLRFQREM